VVRLPRDLSHDYLVMGTKLGEVKKTPLARFANVRRGGLNAMDLEADDELVSVKQASDEDHAVVVTAQGKSLRFKVSALRSASRQSGGVRGIKLAKGDSVVALEIARPNEMVLVVTAQGFGKRTPIEDYPLQGRGGQGVITFKTTPKTGELVSARMVKPTQELMLISDGGIVLRTEVEQISVQGRPTQGVTLMDVEEGESVAAVTIIDMESSHKGEAALPTGATVEPVAAEGAKRSRAARAKAPAKKATPAAKGAAVAKKPAPAAPATAKKAPPVKGKATPAPAARKPAPAAKATAKKPPAAKGKPAPAAKKPPGRQRPSGKGR
jgi:hypothetical protein